MWIDISPDSHQFEGVDGEVHNFPGPSVLGAIEFSSRLAELSQVMATQKRLSGMEFYEYSPRFRWLINRCLEIHGIKPAWVSWVQIERLVFGFVGEDGAAQKALLVQILNPLADSDSAPNSPATPLTTEELIAALAPSHGGIKGAIELLSNVTTNQLAQILSAQAKPLAAPDLSQAAQEKQAMRDYKKRLEDRLMNQQKQQG